MKPSTPRWFDCCAPAAALREAEEQFQRAQRRLEEFNVVRTGALRQAAQVPLQADARPRGRCDLAAAPSGAASRLSLA